MMRWLNPLSVRARLALGIVPLIFLVAAVALMVDRGFNAVGATTRDFETSAQEARSFEMIERCLASSQSALLRFVADRAAHSISEFEADVACMHEIAQRVAPSLIGPLRQYQDAFEDVVRLSAEEADLRQKAISYGPLAMQTLTSIIARETRGGDLETALMAAAIKDKVSESLISLESFLTSDAGVSALALVQDARDMEEAFLSRLTSPLQRGRAETVFALLENYNTRVSEAKEAIDSRSVIERFMLDAIAIHVERAVTQRTAAIRDRRSTLGAAIGVSLQRTQEQVLLLSVIALSVGVLLVLMVGHWVSGTISKMTNLMSRIANGDFGAEVPGADWDNEFGEMARSLRTFQENARRRIEAESEARSARATAETDPVTGLGNRRAIDSQIALLSEDVLQDSSVALIDLNAFKPINDNHGHDAGDAVLQGIGAGLKQVLGDDGFAVRLGGDEFGLLIKASGDRAALANRAKRLLEIFQRSIDYQGTPLRVGACIGIARLRDVDHDLEAAWKAADKTMYAIKVRRVSGFAIYDPETEADAVDEFTPSRIVEGLQNGEFVSFFQPKFDLETGRVIGIDALARWRHPENGLILPGQFLRKIEKFGHINDFTRRILSDALICMRSLQDAGMDPPPLVINLHEVFLSTESSVESLIALIAKHCMEPSDIVVEISENMLSSRNQNHTRAAILRLSEFGCGIALGDFGTGYGSLRHLEELPVQEVKIDRCFIHRIGTAQSSEAIIEAMINLAQGLGMRLVAEGIEREEQVAFLRSRGCRYGQGSLYSPAIDAQGLRDVLAKEEQITADLDRKLAV